MAENFMSKKEYEECYKCGGEVQSEVVGDFRDWVCQDCGVIVDSSFVVENQSRVEELGDDIEVMQ